MKGIFIFCPDSELATSAEKKQFILSPPQPVAYSSLRSNKERNARLAPIHSMKSLYCSKY